MCACRNVIATLDAKVLITSFPRKLVNWTTVPKMPDLKTSFSTLTDITSNETRIEVNLCDQNVKLNASITFIYLSYCCSAWANNVHPLVYIQAQIQGRWNGWVFTPPPLFLRPFFLNLKYLDQALVLLHHYKNSLPISKSWIRAWR